MQRHNGWILHCEHAMYSDWSIDILGVYQACGDEDTGIAIARVENCWVEVRGHMYFVVCRA